MKVIWFLLVLVVLAGAGFWHYSVQREVEIVEFAEGCVRGKTELSEFFGALRSQDASNCDGLPVLYKSRCMAYLLGDSALCSEADLDCLAISSKNLSLCSEESCRAWVSQDLSYCDSLDEDSKLVCVNMVSLNSEFFMMTEEECRTAADLFI